VLRFHADEFLFITDEMFMRCANLFGASFQPKQKSASPVASQPTMRFSGAIEDGFISQTSAQGHYIQAMTQLFQGDCDSIIIGRNPIRGEVDPNVAYIRIPDGSDLVSRKQVRIERTGYCGQIRITNIGLNTIDLIARPPQDNVSLGQHRSEIIDLNETPLAIRFPNEQLLTVSSLQRHPQQERSPEPPMDVTPEVSATAEPPELGPRNAFLPLPGMLAVGKNKGAYSSCHWASLQSTPQNAALQKAFPCDLPEFSPVRSHVSNNTAAPFLFLTSDDMDRVYTGVGMLDSGEKDSVGRPKNNNLIMTDEDGLETAQEDLITAFLASPSIQQVGGKTPIARALTNQNLSDLSVSQIKGALSQWAEEKSTEVRVQAEDVEDLNHFLFPDLQVFPEPFRRLDYTPQTAQTLHVFLDKLRRHDQLKDFLRFYSIAVCNKSIYFLNRHPAPY
jgi:hypothetical protein